MSAVGKEEEGATGQQRATFLAAKERSDAIWAELDESPEKYRVLTGDRPTGPLHIGHYFGTLKNRVLLQNLGVEEFIVIADYQVLTDRDTADSIPQNVQEIVLDYLAAGLDPFGKETHIFCHSYIPELNQLLLPVGGHCSGKWAAKVRDRWEGARVLIAGNRMGQGGGSANEHIMR